MSTKRTLFMVVALSLMALAIGVGSQQTQPVQAVSQDPIGDSIRTTVPYLGQLTDEAGTPVADGAYDLSFALYADAKAGTTLWAETQIGVQVQHSSFSVMLGSVTPIPRSALDGDQHWLAIAVRGPGEKDFTTLAPRQRLTTTSPASPAAGPTCAHDHWGETWARLYTLGGDGLTVQHYYGAGWPVDEAKLATSSGDGVSGASTSGNGVIGTASATNKSGVAGSNTGAGVGVTGVSSTGVGVFAFGMGSTHDHPALLASNLNVSDGIAAYFNNISSFPTLEIDQRGSGSVLDMQNNGGANGAGGGDFIAAYSKDSDFELQFRVESSGTVRSDVGFYTPAADVAEMLPAVKGLEPGDVLIVGDDSQLTRSSKPYQASVVGVYSTQPGFVGGSPVEGSNIDAIPLAIVGVVPVKVTAENGAIQPGDLLVASSVPGRAMKAGPNPPLGSVIGKALEPLKSGTGLIKMLATLQ